MNNNIPQIFNRKLLRSVKERHYKKIIHTDFLLNYASDILIDKLTQTKIVFKKILILGNISQKLINFLANKHPNAKIIYANLSLNYLKSLNKAHKIVLDEENLPFSPAHFDLVISILNLHNINDLPGSFIQIRHILQDKGRFMGIMLGDSTLGSLRQACIMADSQYNKASPKVAPFIDIKTLGNLLVRAGFFMPITDSENIAIEYQRFFTLLEDIKNMGEGNILYKKSLSLLGKGYFKLLEKIYLNKFTNLGIVKANFELISLTGLKN
jgi:NADH dehydrogenase [ubiquinone] 1 alpha subcomplex assembly factor 5